MNSQAKVDNYESDIGSSASVWTFPVMNPFQLGFASGLAEQGTKLDPTKAQEQKHKEAQALPMILSGNNTQSPNSGKEMTNGDAYFAAPESTLSSANMTLPAGSGNTMTALPPFQEANMMASGFSSAIGTPTPSALESPSLADFMHGSNAVKAGSPTLMRSMSLQNMFATVDHFGSPMNSPMQGFATPPMPSAEYGMSPMMSPMLSPAAMQYEGGIPVGAYLETHPAQRGNSLKIAIPRDAHEMSCVNCGLLYSCDGHLKSEHNVYCQKCRGAIKDGKLLRPQYQVPYVGGERGFGQGATVIPRHLSAPNLNPYARRRRAGSTGRRKKPCKCDNCGTNDSPVWRKSKAGGRLCNACGLHEKIHGRPRQLRNGKVVKVSELSKWQKEQLSTIALYGGAIPE